MIQANKAQARDNNLEAIYFFIGILGAEMWNTDSFPRNMRLILAIFLT